MVYLLTLRSGYWHTGRLGISAIVGRNEDMGLLKLGRAVQRSTLIRETPDPMPECSPIVNPATEALAAELAR